MILSFMIMSFFHDYVITNSLLRFISPKSDLPAEMKHPPENKQGAGVKPRG